MGAPIRPRRPPADGRQGDATLRWFACIPLAVLMVLGAPAAADPMPAPAPAAAPSPSASDDLDRQLGRLLADPGPPLDPDVFGYQAIAIGPTALDQAWRDAQAPAASPLPADWAALVARIGGLPLRAQAEAVDEFVNRRVAVATDQEVYGVADHWASLAETIAAGRGDCEDFAIAKMRLLQMAGVPSRLLYLVLVRDTRRQVDHAVLLVRESDALLVLDSEAERVRTAGEVTAYRPIAGFSGESRWLFQTAQAAAALDAAEHPPGVDPAILPAPAIPTPGAARTAPDAPQ